MERLFAIVATLLAGALVAAQPPANAEMSKYVGVLGAAFFSLAISLVLIGVLLLATGQMADLQGISSFRPEHALGGIAGAAIVGVSLVTVRELGAGGVVAAMVCTQLIGSLVLDKLGVLGLKEVGITPARLIGVALLVAGTVLLTSGD